MHDFVIVVCLIPEKISEPFAWSGPRTVFVNSMSDLFQPDVPDDYIEDVVHVMDTCRGAGAKTLGIMTK